MRIVPKGFKIKMHWGNWDIPPIFKLIMESGDISKEEMRKVFNVGIGLVAIIHRSDEELTLQLAHEVKEHPLVIGEIE